MLPRCLLLTMMLCAAQPAVASRLNDLDLWVESDLVPYVQRELSSLPRFRDESLRFVVMEGDSPQSEGSELSLKIRDRLRDAVVDLPGVNVVWRGDQPGVGLAAGGALDCTSVETDYFIGVEVRQDGRSDVDITVRALDVRERSWVSGFRRDWRGRITTAQRRSLNTVTDDPTFRGERFAPWQDSETDLMAAQLAYELACSLVRQLDGEYVISGTRGDETTDAELLELVSNNLAGVRALRFSADNANAVIEGKAHRIDSDLYQYWVTITPLDESSPMSALSADAYVRIPNRYATARLLPEDAITVPSGDTSFIEAVSVVRLGEARFCDRWETSRADTRSRYAFRKSDCFAIEVESAGDAVYFFLRQPLNGGLLRLSDESCTTQTDARIGRASEAIRFPLAPDLLRTGEWAPASEWSLVPDADSYFVIGTTNSKAARALSRHVADLPRQCSASVRRGLEGEDLRRWMDGLTALLERWPGAIDWRVIRVRDIY